MDPILSIYLDLIRVGAAIVVALSHAWPVLFPHFPLPFPGHQAVIVFFVLSGFVIAYTTDRKDRTLKIYMANRLSRLWSVIIPALLIGALIIPMAGGNRVSEAAPLPLNWSFTGVDSVLNLLFVAQFWGFVGERFLRKPLLMTQAAEIHGEDLPDVHPASSIVCCLLTHRFKATNDLGVFGGAVGHRIVGVLGREATNPCWAQLVTIQFMSNAFSPDLLWNPYRGARGHKRTQEWPTRHVSSLEKFAGHDCQLRLGATDLRDRWKLTFLCLENARTPQQAALHHRQCP